MKKALSLIWKVALLTGVFFLSFMIGSVVSGLPGVIEKMEPVAGYDPTNAGQFVLLFHFATTCVLTYLMLRSRLSGWRLAGAVFLAFFGSNTFITQIESAVFLPEMLPAGMVPCLFIMGAIMAAIYSPLAVLILGKMKQDKSAEETSTERQMSLKDLVGKFAIAAVSYAILYFVFGYYVAWQSPDVQAYYGGSDPGNFFLQLGHVWKTTPLLYPFQVFRGFIWAALSLPLVKSLKGQRLEVAFASGLLFAVWSLQLFTPNPFMPVAVAHTHFLEMFPSNFIFGCITGWLLHRPQVADRCDTLLPAD